MPILKTFVAPLLKANGRPILRSGDTKSAIFWLDELLEGGFYVPEKLGRPLIVLLSGPPGAGKSLLAQEISYNRARRFVSGTKDCPIEEACSVLMSFETPACAIEDNLTRLGFTNEEGNDGRAIYWGVDLSKVDQELDPPKPHPPFTIINLNREFTGNDYGAVAQRIGSAWSKLQDTTPNSINRNVSPAGPTA